jgi:hypothetical protein
MALRDPVAVYNAASNTEAHVVRQGLISADVDAHVPVLRSVCGRRGHWADDLSVADDPGNWEGQ